MADTKIEWAEKSWNPVTGCTPVSAGCANCYAKRMAQRLRGRAGYPADDPFRVTLHPDKLDEPLHWRKPRRVFVCSMSDLFHKDVPDEYLIRVFDVMRSGGLAIYGSHTFLVLTKRPERMKDFCERLRFDGSGNAGKGRMWLAKDEATRDGWRPMGGHGCTPANHIHLGVSISNQPDADKMLPFLLQTPAAVRFVSYEPALAGIEIAEYLRSWCPECERPLLGGKHFRGRSCGTCHAETARLDWIICGAETGPGARPMDLDWARSVRDQCAEAGVPFFFKRDSDGNRKLDGKLHEGYPTKGD